MFSFAAMGTVVSVAAPGLRASEEHALSCDVQSLFEIEEQRFSRFSERSELAQLQRARGPVVVSPELFEVLAAAHDHHRATGGLFDPAIGSALEALGYDRSFERGGLDREHEAPRSEVAHFDELVLDPATRTVARPPHLRIDLGGLVKGRTVDRAAAMLPSPGMVEAGGDAYLRGAGFDAEGFLVDVEDPADSERVLLTLRVRDRGVATSAPNRRRWRLGTEDAHHLIDPRSQRPSTSDLAQVTVIAATAELADVLSKSLYLLGKDAAREALTRMGDVGAVLVDRSGHVEISGPVEVQHA